MLLCLGLLVAAGDVACARGASSDDATLAAFAKNTHAGARAVVEYRYGGGYAAAFYNVTLSEDGTVVRGASGSAARGDGAPTDEEHWDRARVDAIRASLESAEWRALPRRGLSADYHQTVVTSSRVVDGPFAAGTGRVFNEGTKQLGFNP